MTIARRSGSYYVNQLHVTDAERCVASGDPAVVPVADGDKLTTRVVPTRQGTWYTDGRRQFTFDSPGQLESELLAAFEDSTPR